LSSTEVADVLQAAIEGRSGVIVLFAHSGETSARCIYPVSCRKAKDGGISVWAWDSMRQGRRSFLVDRICTAHPLRGPPVGAEQIAGEQ